MAHNGSIVRDFYFVGTKTLRAVELGEESWVENFFKLVYVFHLFFISSIFSHIHSHSDFLLILLFDDKTDIIPFYPLLFHHPDQSRQHDDISPFI